MSLNKPLCCKTGTGTKSIYAVKSLVKFLDKIYGAVGDYIEDESGVVKCLYFQDPSMKDIFNFYPDRICIDLTFKRFEIDLYMYTFFCEDANGRNYIIAVGFLQLNDNGSLLWLFDTFKKHNPNWRKIKFMAMDPEIKPQELRKDCFHQPTIICFYHALRSFQNDINNLKEFGDVSEEQKLCAIELFKNLLYAHSQSDFEIFFQQYLLLPETLVSYLHQTWIPKKSEWRIPLDYAHENIFLNLNSFLQHFNDAVQALLGTESNSIEFIKKIFLIILLKKKEKPSLFLQPVSFLYSRFSPEYQISKALTPYAAKFVIEQLDLSSEISIDVTTLSDFYSFDYLGMTISASSSICSCNFYLYTTLPCRHIFAVRKFNYFCVFDQSLIGYGWNMEYYQHTLTCMQGYLSHGTGCRIPQDFSSRMSLASHLFEVSVPHLLEVSKEVYESRYAVLRKLVNAWKRDEDVNLLFVGIEEKNNKVKDVNMSIPGPSNESSSSKKGNSDSASLQNSKLSREIHDVQPPRNNHVPERNIRRRQGLSDFNTSILDGEHINLAYICCVICFTKESCVEWMKQMDLIATSMKCPLCSSEMVSKTVLRLSDGVIWYCPKIGENKKSCGKRCSVRLGSWFEHISMTLEQILTFSYLWVNRFTRRQIISETGITSSLYVTCDKFHSRVCEESLAESHSSDDSNGASSHGNVLDRWLQKHVGEDTFVQFLKTATQVHQKGAAKCAPVEENK